MEQSLSQVACIALGAVFAWSALAKLMRFREWSTLVPRYQMPAAIEVAARPAVPLVEAMVAALLFVGASRAGAALAMLLLGAFSLAVLRARRLQGDRLPCGCFGKIDERDYRFILVRNVLLALIAGTILLGGVDVAPFAGLGAPEASEIVPAFLVALGVALAVWMIRSLSTSARGGRS